MYMQFQAGAGSHAVPCTGDFAVAVCIGLPHSTTRGSPLWQRRCG